MRLDWESDYEERDRVIELYRLSRDYDGLVGGISIERNDYIINNRDLPCAVLDDYNFTTIMINMYLLEELVYL